jgi:hypothetical protein
MHLSPPAHMLRTSCISLIQSLASFYVLLTVQHLVGIILVNNQLDAQFFFFVYVYSKSLHISNTHVLIIRRINCINTTSGVCHSMWVPAKPAYQTVTYIEWHIPDVLMQLILLMMSTWVLEHVKIWNKHIQKRKICASSWLFTRIMFIMFDETRKLWYSS